MKLLADLAMLEWLSLFWLPDSDSVTLNPPSIPLQGGSGELALLGKTGHRYRAYTGWKVRFGGEIVCTILDTCPQILTNQQVTHGKLQVYMPNVDAVDT